MTKLIPVFKLWAPEWLIKFVLFIVLLPSLVLFFLPLANTNAAAGYYGIEPADVQFSVVVFYAGYTSFFSLERRFFSYLATKEYFFIFTFIQIISSFLCYITQSLFVLLILRFIQGMCLTCTANVALALISNRLKTERAREIGYSVYFGMLICMIPFNNFITANLIDSFNFNTLYKGAMFSYIPSMVLLSLIMNNVRMNVKFPLYLLDWPSFVLYATGLSLLGYVMVYGQQYYWLGDKRILGSCVAISLLLIVFVVRQTALKRPYFNLSVFKHRNFILGGVILFILYICRFAFGITTNYFGSVLGLDPIHISYINLFNISGIVVGVIISCTMVLQRRPIRLIWIYGFFLLLLFHFWMLFLVQTQANENVFYVPLTIQGLGVGMLMTPTIIFMVSAAPLKFGGTAAGICLLVRCLGFFISIALVNYYELYAKSTHYNKFQETVSITNPYVQESFQKQNASIAQCGVASDQAKKITEKLLVNRLAVQGHIRFTIDYYEMMCDLLIFTLLLSALFPFISRTVVYLRSKQPVPF